MFERFNAAAPLHLPATLAKTSPARLPLCGITIQIVAACWIGWVAIALCLEGRSPSTRSVPA